MKRLEIEQMEEVSGGGWGKCLAGGIGGYLVGFAAGLEGGGVLAGIASVAAVANPAGIVIGAAIIGGVALGIAGAAYAC